ncbi:hypothetical protein CDIK_4043 [Cucumispora dikerogammari]|nr:hypothetical protein CDIK_4043 [Cucumispora dikerogammari]
MVGVIDQNTKRFYIAMVKDRTIQSIVEFLIKFFVPGSIIVSDCFASYPTAVNRHGSIHQFCNYSAMEWVNEQGYHTNLIENLWMHFIKKCIDQEIKFYQFGWECLFMDLSLERDIFKKKIQNLFKSHLKKP